MGGIDACWQPYLLGCGTVCFQSSGEWHTFVTICVVSSTRAYFSSALKVVLVIVIETLLSQTLDVWHKLYRRTFIVVKIIWWPVILQGGETPLHSAARSGSGCIVELLLEKGVNAEVMTRVWSFSAVGSRLVKSIVCIWFLGKFVYWQSCPTLSSCWLGKDLVSL